MACSVTDYATVAFVGYESRPRGDAVDSRNERGAIRPNATYVLGESAPESRSEAS